MDHIFTTHVGSLPRPKRLIELNRARVEQRNVDDELSGCLRSSVVEVLQKQRELGIDIPNDGEFGKPMAANYDYGVWWNYAFARLEGFAPADSVPESIHKKSSVAALALASFTQRRDWAKFNEFYLDPESSATLIGSAAKRPTRRPVCVGPVRYVGHASIQTDIENLRRALSSNGFNFGFMTAVAPGSFARGENLH